MVFSFAVRKLLSLIRFQLFLFLFSSSRRWIPKDIAATHVRQRSACVFLYKIYSTILHSGHQKFRILNLKIVYILTRAESLQSNTLTTDHI